jgi:methionine sulfoxide reductase catalytic subunit
MPSIYTPPAWQLPEKRVTPETTFINRRQLIKSLVGAGIGASLSGLTACQRPNQMDPELEKTLGSPLRNIEPNAAFVNAGREPTEQRYASRYNNFYEYGGTKSIWQLAQKLPTDPWKLEVGGLVKTPKTYDLDDLTRQFPLEERIYRFRCVEAWAMVVPWIGFPMKRILEAVEPTAQAKFVRFTSFYDDQICPGPAWGFASNLPWPYVEGLTVAEMANDLAFFAVGIYGRTLPKQHGAPIRMVVPWKYGFKGGKSIVKIEFVEQQPATYWNTISPNEYAFEANVEPEVPHPRWSQSKERLLGEGSNPYTWETQPTVIYNGYGEYVASLYS